MISIEYGSCVFSIDSEYRDQFETDADFLEAVIYDFDDLWLESWDSQMVD
jgi:hypothetical protein